MSQAWKQNRHIIVFDGVCNFCNGAVRFIANRDPEGVFAFTPMQSELAAKLMHEHQISNLGIDTFMLVKNGKAHVWSDAALEIARDLSGYWYFFNALRIIPASIRDFFYRLFARNRYKLFGRSDECVIPTQELKSRFIDV